MILDYKMVGRIYWFVCEENKYKCLKDYSDDLLDTTRAIIQFLDSNAISKTDELASTIYGLAEIFKVIINDDHIHLRYIKDMPDILMKIIIASNKSINKDAINNGITPKDFFDKPERGYLKYDN